MCIDVSVCVFVLKCIYGTNLFYASLGLDGGGKILHFKHEISMENVQRIPQSVLLCNIYIDYPFENHLRQLTGCSKSVD